MDCSSVLWPSETVDVSDLHPDAAEGSGDGDDALPERLDENLALVLGVLVADGAFRERSVVSTKAGADLSELFESVFEQVFRSCRIHRSEREAVGLGPMPYGNVEVLDKSVTAFLQNLGLVGGPSRQTVPERILRSPKNVVAAFLRALYEGDGTVERSGRALLRVSLPSESRRLLSEVQTLLLRFGIAAALADDQSGGTYRLMITGRWNLARFQAEIGFLSTRKSGSLKKALDTGFPRGMSHPGFNRVLSEFVRRRAGGADGDRLPRHIFEGPESLQGPLPRLPEALLGDRDGLPWLRDPRYLFEQVTTVSPAGLQPVYSIRVESDCHSFVANGFVSHNTEVKMARIASELLRDIEKETVPFGPNFDESTEEPLVLPSRFPNLLVNGSAGIAVGMATNIPPHNLGEVIDGCLAILDRPETTTADLMKNVRGPDFPTGGEILGREGIRKAFETGRGTVIMRSVASIEIGAQGKPRIVVTEIPYQVSKARLLEKIAELVREKKVDGITDLRDESDRAGLRIVIELRRDVNARIVLNKLFKFTPMQQSFGIIMLALVGGRPQILSLREILGHYLDYQREIIVNRTRHDLRKAEERAHILEGLLICLDNLDAVISLIRSSADAAAAKEGLMSSFDMTDVQAQAVLDLRLHRLTALERSKIEEEYDELQKSISYYRAILASDEMVTGIIKTELSEIKKTYATPRLTEIVADPGEISEEDLVADAPVVITMSHQGYIKRQPVGSYRSQKRGGRGIAGMNTKEEDFVERIFVTSARRTILFFTSRGRVFRLKSYEIPEAGRTAKGTAIVNLLNLSGDEQVSAVIPLNSDQVEGHVFMCTRKGRVKKTKATEFASIRSSGLIALSLEDGDELIDVRFTSQDVEVMLVTRLGQAIRFRESDVRPMGRTARGVIGIRLGPRDHVQGVAVAERGVDLLAVTSRGMAKRSPIESYRTQGRGGRGIKLITLTDRSGEVVGVQTVDDDDQLMIITGKGVLIRFAVSDVPSRGRTTQGVRAMRLDEGDTVLDVAKLAADVAQSLETGEAEDEE